MRVVITVDDGQVTASTSETDADNDSAAKRSTAGSLSPADEVERELTANAISAGPAPDATAEPQFSGGSTGGGGADQNDADAISAGPAPTVG